MMAAYRDRRALGHTYVVALLLYVVAGVGFVGIVLWRLWTEVLHAWPN